MCRVSKFGGRGISKPVSNKERSLEELLKAYQDGDADAFREFFTRTKKFIFNFILMRLRNHTDAEDVFQETYFRLHRYIMRFDSDRKAIVWLISIARNALIDKVKAKKLVMIDQEILNEFAAKETADERLTLHELLEELLSGLSQDEAELITGRIFNEDTYEDIAKKYKTTEVNARQKVSRIMKKMKASWIK